MENKISLTGNIVLRAGYTVSSLCNPLSNHLNIGFFRYVKIFEDGSKFILCNEPALMQFMYEEGHYINTWYDNGKPSRYFQPGCKLWAIDKLSCDEEENFVGDEIKKYFQYTNGFLFCYQQPNYVELFDFIGKDPSIYYIKKQLLQRFIIYFKHQAKKLIAKAEHEKIYLPQPTDLKLKNTNNIDEKSFLAEILLNQNTSDNHNYPDPDSALSSPLLSTNHIPLSQREIQILSYLPKGKSAKQIAQILGISY